MGILDSLSKNPSVIALAALGIGLFIFRDKISGFFSDITGGAQGAASVAALGGRAAEGLNVQLDNLDNFFKDPFGGFEFPKIELPSFEFPTFEFPEINLPDIFAPRDTTDITETPAAMGRASDRGRIMDVIGSIIPEIGIVQSAIPDQQFFGGGPSFIGGSVSEIPLERLSLGQITEQLGISASRAASLRAEAIGFTPQEESFLGIGSNPPSVSGGFEGLTPEEIALRLTGGVITNF